jgi:hypothetical protein
MLFRVPSWVVQLVQPNFLLFIYFVLVSRNSHAKEQELVGPVDQGGPDQRTVGLSASPFGWTMLDQGAYDPSRSRHYPWRSIRLRWGQRQVRPSVRGTAVIITVRCRFFWNYLPSTAACWRAAETPDGSSWGPGLPRPLNHSIIPATPSPHPRFDTSAGAIGFSELNVFQALGSFAGAREIRNCEGRNGEPVDIG